MTAKERIFGRLNSAQVKNAKPKAGRRREHLSDGGNLYLELSRATAGHVHRSWTFRYELDGHRREMGLGGLHTVTLAEARQRARLLRQQLLDGVDPLEARRNERMTRRLEVAKAMTFGQCVKEYLTAHDAAWTNSKHRDQWRMTLTEYCKPLADLPVKAIDTDLVLKVLTPLWTTRTETARKLRGRIERVLAWAKVRELRDGENPARWHGHLDEMLPEPSKVRTTKHLAAVPYPEMPEFMAALRARESVSARALEFTILTAVRTGEALGAQWGEIDFDDKKWTIPAERMKGGEEHSVPLAKRAVEILTALPPKRRGYIFPGTASKPLSNMALLMQLRGLRTGATVHGFRSSFRTWASEQTNFAHEVCEAALAHKVPDAVVRAYRRTDFFERRRALMAAWATYSATQPSKAKVVPLHGGGRG